jgi:hypothetical protein
MLGQSRFVSQLVFSEFEIDPCLNRRLFQIRNLIQMHSVARLSSQWWNAVEDFPIPECGGDEAVVGVWRQDNVSLEHLRFGDRGSPRVETKEAVASETATVDNETLIGAEEPMADAPLDWERAAKKVWFESRL